MRKIHWHSHFQEQAKSSLSIAEYCKKNCISPSAFYQARKRDRESNSFTPVVVKEASRKAVCLEMSLSLAEDGQIEFRGTTSSKELISALVAGAWR